MTLQEWSKLWPYTVQQHKLGAMWTPDTSLIRYGTIRRQAWSLSDYRVSSVSGGSIWFTKRDEVTK